MKKRIRNDKSMTSQLWRAFAFFAVVIMLALWLLQIMFLSAFYESMKKSEIEKIGEKFAEVYKSGENFEDFWSENSLHRGLFASIISADGTVVKSPEPMKEFKNKRHNNDKPEERNTPERLNSHMWSDFTETISASRNGTATYVYYPDNRGKMVVYGALLGGSGSEALYLYITSPLEPIDATRDVLQTQLAIVSVLSILLAFVLAYFIAKGFSRPIMKVSDSAKKLADGKYDVRFEKGAYKEINELSDVLNTAAKQLGETDELRRDLMANVSHDLKTPLTIIKSYAEMIRDISGDNKQKRDVHTQVIIDEANRLSALVNDILSLSKLESGVLEAELEDFSLSTAVNSSLESFGAFAEKGGYVIESQIEPDITVCGDKGQIIQAIYNLISNAVNYTGDDRRIKVTLSSDGTVARFEVADTGEGIADEELPFVWDRYYRIGKSHKRELAGTGIGLSIVKCIFEVHGFAYGVNSKKGEGSVFWFEAPLSDNTDL